MVASDVLHAQLLTSVLHQPHGGWQLIGQSVLCICMPGCTCHLS